MNNYHDRPDGETFLDVSVKSIPTADTWNTLSVNQLLEIQTQLQTRAWEFRSNEAISKSLSAAITRIQGLISKQLVEPK